MPSLSHVEPASPAQVEYLRTLLAEREQHPDAEVIRVRLNKMREEHKMLSRKGASEAIDALRAIPAFRKVAGHQTLNEVESKVADGYYALPLHEGSAIRFYRVTRGKPGTENDDRPVATFHTVQDARDAVAAFNKTADSEITAEMARLLSELDRHDRHVVTAGKWTSGMRHRVLAVLERWVLNA